MFSTRTSQNSQACPRMRTEQGASSRPRPSSRRNAVMRPLHPNPTERCQMSTSDLALQSDMQTLSEMKELYWFAMALTGDPEFAAKLVVDTKKLPSTGRGVFRN